MKKVSYFLVIAAVAVFAACTQQKATQPVAEVKKDVAPVDPKLVAEGPNEKFIDSTNISPAYVLVERPQVNLDEFTKDKNGVITLFDGSSLKGWRGYNKDTVPGMWSIENKTLKIKGSGTGEAQSENGGDIIFAHKFKNFELTFEWKVSKGANSGVFILAREIKGEPIWISSPEYQILDNINHLDAKLGENGNRQSASLYDMIPAKPQNAKPVGEWNTGGIIVYQGTVIYQQNGKNVVEYHLWTPKWEELINSGKFKKGGDYPLAYSMLTNVGGDGHEGYIGFQDHGTDVWFRNIKIKITD